MSTTPQQYVLLTATVRPNTTKKLAVVDPQVRLRQYRSALREWVEIARRLDARVIIVETSGFDRSAFLSEVDPGDQSLIHYVAYEPTPEVIGRGIGFIEWSAIAFALDTVRLEDTDTVYKVTGRLRVTNPRQVFGVLDADGVRLRMRVDGLYCDTRVLGASVGVWRSVVLPAADDVDYPNRIEIEHTVAAHVTRARALRTASLSSFPKRPLFAGQSGTNGSHYSPLKLAVQGLLVRPFEPIVAFAARSISH